MQIKNENMFNEVVRTVYGSTDKKIDKAMFGTGFALGTITKTGLSVDNVKQEFSKDDYTALDYLELEDSYNTQSASDHSHAFTTPDKLKSLQVGDRVLVAQVSATYCVVVGRVSNG